MPIISHGYYILGPSLCYFLKGWLFTADSVQFPQPRLMAFVRENNHRQVYRTIFGVWLCVLQILYSVRNSTTFSNKLIITIISNIIQPYFLLLLEIVTPASAHFTSCFRLLLKLVTSSQMLLKIVTCFYFILIILTLPSFRFFYLLFRFSQEKCTKN